MGCGKLRKIILLIIKESIQGKDHINAQNVGKVLLKVENLILIKGSTQNRDHINACSMEKQSKDICSRKNSHREWGGTTLYCMECVCGFSGKEHLTHEWIQLWRKPSKWTK
uniref:Uncharacterized protein n=1 Tax=Micrurus lemniscatus lemniscatus TaxID=129467 RepID=A0A2D4I6Y2_MICLE